MLSSMRSRSPYQREGFVLARATRDELRTRGRYLGDPQKGLRFQRATIHAGRRSDFYSRSLMIAPVETGLKVHAGNDTTFGSRRHTTARSGLTSSSRGGIVSSTLIPTKARPGARGEAPRVRVRTDPHREPRGLACRGFRGRWRLLRPLHVSAAASANCPPCNRPGSVWCSVHPFAVADRTLDHAVAVDLATRLVLPFGGPVLGDRGGFVGQRCRAPTRSARNQPAVRPAHALRHRRPRQSRRVSAPQTTGLLAATRSLRSRQPVCPR